MLGHRILILCLLIKNIECVPFLIGCLQNADCQAINTANGSLPFSTSNTFQGRLIPSGATTLSSVNGNAAAIQIVQAIIGDYDPGVASVATQNNIPYYILSNYPAVGAPNLFRIAPNLTDLGAFVTYYGSIFRTNNGVYNYGYDGTQGSLDLFRSLQNSVVNFCAIDNGLDNITIFNLIATYFDSTSYNKSFIFMGDWSNSSWFDRVLKQALYQNLIFNGTFIFPMMGLQESVISKYKEVGGQLVFIDFMPQLDWRSKFLADAVKHFALSMNSSATVPATGTNTILLQVLGTTYTGDSGAVSFLPNGQRANIFAYVHSYSKSNSLVQLYNLSNRNGVFSYVVNDASALPDITKLVRVATYVNVVFMPDDPLTSTSADGFAIALTNALCSAMQVTCSFVYAPDMINGLLINGTWSGMAALLASGAADMTAFPIEDIYGKQNSIEFTDSVMLAGYNMLVNQTQRTLELFRILTPFSGLVWICTGATVSFLVIFLYIINLISPDKTTGDEELTFPNCILYMFTSVLMAKLSVKPKMISVRIFYLGIWFGALLLVASYAANLNAMQTVTFQPVVPFDSMETLMSVGLQSGYKWFFLQNGSLHGRILNYIKANSTSKLLYKAINASNAWPDIAFIDQSSNVPSRLTSTNNSLQVYIDYALTTFKLAINNCNLRQVSPEREVRSLAIASRVNWTRKPDLDTALRALQNSGQMDVLQQTYLLTGSCVISATSTSDVNPLDMSNISGLFIVAAAGLVFGIIFACLELMIHHCRLLCQRCGHGGTLRFGKIYSAHVTAVESDGVWFSVKGQQEPFFLYNDFLGQKKGTTVTAADMGLVIGVKMKVKFLGNDPVSGQKKFVKINEDD